MTNGKKWRSAILIFSLLFISLLFYSAVFPPSADAKEIIFWTTEIEMDRMVIQNEIAAAFRKKTGISVKVVPVGENLLPQRIIAAYAAKSLPDVVFHPIDHTIGWIESGILDFNAATEIINDLGQKTFGDGPLNLAKTSTGFAAVPVDGWGQLLLYRKDLFKKNGLRRPDNWDAIIGAASSLHNPPLMWGFETATDPGQSYTQQVFEHFALSNGVKLMDQSGNINLNTPEMIETLEFYKSLSRFSPPGNLYWLHTRMDYLSGRAAMIIWSPFILDELSGLRKDQPVIPDIVKSDPGFLARNSGLVTAIRGPKGEAQYGQINYLGITRDADKASSKEWIGFLLGDGYLKWLSMAPEGKLPLRKGSVDASDRFVKGWLDLDFGITTRDKISRFYGMDVAKALMAGIDSFDRWGFSEGEGALISKIYGTKIIPVTLKLFLDNEINAAEAAGIMDQKVKGLR